MTINAANWVGENTATVGIGAIVLSGAIDGFARFNVMGDGDVYYVVQDGLKKETGIGTLVGNTLTRTTIHATIDEKGVYSSTPSPLSLSGNAQVFGIINAEFMMHLYNNVDGITEAAAEAAASAQAASTSAAAALASKNAASTSEMNASSSASGASGSAIIAQNAQTAAETARDAAKTSADNAKASETVVAANAAAAKVSQDAAKESQTDAAASKNSASGSATTATQQAAAALASKNAAATSATNAAGSATAAAASESAANTSRQQAATSASNASTSETNALTSKNAAAASASAASSSATDAANTAAALGNLDEFSKAIDSVNATSKEVKMKGAFVVTNGVAFSEKGSTDNRFSWYIKSDTKQLAMGVIANPVGLYGLDLTNAQGVGAKSISAQTIRLRNGNQFDVDKEFNFSISDSSSVIQCNKTPNVGTISWADVIFTNINGLNTNSNVTAKGGYSAYTPTGAIVNQGGPTFASSIRDGGVPGGRVRANADFWVRGNDQGQRQGVLRVHGDDMSQEQNWLFLGAGANAGRIAGSAGTVLTDQYPTSDAILKNIDGDSDLEACAARVDALEFKDYHWNNHEYNIQVGADETLQEHGVIAQQAMQVDPRYVVINRQYLGSVLEGRYFDKHVLNTTPMLLDAMATIKLMRQQLSALQAEVAELKNK
jgi:hypothetical protein